MKSITRADWGLQLEAFARTIAPLIAAAWLAVLLTREAFEWARRLDRAGAPAAPALPPAACTPCSTPIRIPAAELLAAGGLEAAEIEAIITPPAAAPRKRSKRSTRRDVRSS